MFNIPIKNIFSELKNRKVTKWLTIYFSTGLTILGAVNLFSSRYNIPGSVFDALVILLIFGFVSIIIAAWNHGRSGFSGWKKEEIAAHAIIGVMAVTVVYLFKSDNIYPVAYTSRSIAVLPFINLSENKDDEFFSSGITEDILIHLSKISDLKVISKSSMLKYKDSKKTIPEIGKELGVETILEGSIRRVGSRVRISGELIDTKNDRNIWAEYYDRDITDIFKIQSDVAQKIAEALKIKLKASEKQRIEKKSTDNIDAYTLYLKGRENYSRYTKSENDMAIDLFKKALQIDKNYALAYSGLADAYSQGVQRFGFTTNWLDSSFIMTQKAIELNPDIAEPYKALGLYYDMKGYQKKALEYYLKAVELNPNYAPAIANVGSLYWWTGEYNKALPWFEKNISLSPTRASGYNSLGLLHLGLTNYNEAEKLFKTAIDLQANFTSAAGNLVKLYILTDKLDLARRTALKYYNLYPDDIQITTAAGNAYLFSGILDSALIFFGKGGTSVEVGYLYTMLHRESEGRHILDSVLTVTMTRINNYTEEFTPSYDLARIYSALNQTDEAVKWFRNAVTAGWLFYQWSSRDPLLKNIRNNPAFLYQINMAKNKVEKMKSL